MEKILLQDLTGYRFLASPKLSPDGKKAAFLVYRADEEKNATVGDLWCVGLGGGQARALTDTGKVSSFDFLDGETLLYPEAPEGGESADGSEQTVFVRLALSGEKEKAFAVPLAHASATVLGEGKYLLSALYDNARPDFASMDEAQRRKALAQYEEEQDYLVCDETPFWLNARGFVNKKRRRLYLFDEKTGDLTPITSPMTEVRAVAVSPDKGKIAYAGLEFEKIGHMNSGIYLYTLSTGETRELVPPTRFNITALDFLGEHILFPAEDRGADHAGFGSADLYSVHMQTGQLRREARLADDQDMGCLTGSDCRYGGGAFFQAAGETLYYITTYRFTSAVNRFRMGSAPQRLTGADSFGVVTLAAAGDTLVAVGNQGVALQELYAIDGQGNARQLTDINEAALAGKYVAQPEYLSFINAQGTEIDGWVLKPFGYQAGKRYPAVLDIHGGPRTSFCAGFFHQMQMMASDGCFVLFCNPTGSAGRGDAFADICGKYGTVDYEDLMRFTDAALEKYPDIDRERLGVLGGSYGGFMTNWIIGHTDRFKAAASQRGISNWVTMYTVSDIGPRFTGREQRATPWDGVERLWQHSPLKYAMDVKTPTLFIHSSEDFRCWLPEAIQIYTALQLKGVETRLCIFKGENHELSRSGKPKHRLRRLREIRDWLYKYIME